MLWNLSSLSNICFMSVPSLDSAEMMSLFLYICAKCFYFPLPAVSGAAGARLQSRGVWHFPGSRLVSHNTVLFSLRHTTLVGHTYCCCCCCLFVIFSKVRRYLTRCCSALNIYQSLCHSWRYSARHSLVHERKLCWLSVFDMIFCVMCVGSGLSRHDGPVSHVSSGWGVPHSGKPSGHAGKATNGR